MRVPIYPKKTLVRIAMFLTESDSTFAPTCAFVIAPDEKHVNTQRKIAAHRSRAAVVARKIACPATANSPVSAFSVCKEFLRQLTVVTTNVRTINELHDVEHNVGRWDANMDVSQ